jgi:hypothetical protein
MQACARRAKNRACRIKNYYENNFIHRKKVAKLNNSLCEGEPRDRLNAADTLMAKGAEGLGTAMRDVMKESS